MKIAKSSYNHPLEKLQKNPTEKGKKNRKIKSIETFEFST
jgi:hypothetical protein